MCRGWFGTLGWGGQDGFVPDGAFGDAQSSNMFSSFSPFFFVDHIQCWSVEIVVNLLFRLAVFVLSSKLVFLLRVPIEDAERVRKSKSSRCSRNCC